MKTRSKIGLFLLLLAISIPCRMDAAGAWVALTNQAPGNVDTMLVLSDGTVMAANGFPSAGGFGNAWFKLTPDTNGSYINGTWSTLASMNYTRLYYASQVLQDGRVLVAGGEYGSGSNNAEIYNPLSNTWTVTPPPPAGQSAFADCPSEILSNGDVLVAPDGPAAYGQTVIYSVASNEWVVGPTLANNNYYQAEATWVKLPDQSILTIDPFGTNSERYIPALNQWISDANTPVPIYGGTEMGGGVLTASGQAFFLGGAGYTDLYTPTGNTSMGSWQAGAVIPNSQICADAPTAIMVNGKVLVTAAPPSSSPTSFYEYDPGSNTYTQINGPVGMTFNSAAFPMRMVDLPDGTVLFSTSSAQLFAYVPDGAPLAAFRPVVNSVTTNGGNTYHLTGTKLNGPWEGASYGDDAQMNSNYPLVRMTNSAGQVFYARTTNWSSTGVMTGTNIVSTDFTLPANFPQGIYSLVAVGNGFASAPVQFVVSPDVLLASTPSPLLFAGTAGGPFTPATITFTLTNVGAAALNWSFGNGSPLLNASASAGTLTPGGPSATVAVSLNSSATNLSFGDYSATIWFTNLTDNFVQSRTITIQASPPQLAQNGGFETGDFTDWTQSGVMDGFEFVTNDPAFIHSGHYGAQIGPGGALYYLTQDLPTTPGEFYLLNFYLINYNGDGPNEFLAQWGSTVLFDQVDMGLTSGWSNFSYFVTATGATTALQFGFRNDPYYFAFDDVTVTAMRVPAFQSVLTSAGSINLTWTAQAGPEYQVQYTTNLTQPNWIDLGGPVDGVTGTMSEMDISPADRQRFYRLQMLP